MGDESENRTFKEKLLFYTTAFFILLGTFSMFAFLFLVPFVIEPAFTTIFMQFEEIPALCETYDVEINYGAKNCSWSSCREGCTKDIYICTQVRVNYRLNLYNFTDEFNFTEYHINLKEAEREIPPIKRTDRYERAIRDYEYDGIGEHPISMATYNLAALNDNNNNNNNGVGNADDDVDADAASDIINTDLDSESIANMQQDIRRNTHLAHVAFGDPDGTNGFFIEGNPELSNNDDILDADTNNPFDEISKLNEGLMGNNSMYYYVGARLFPNVKGCGYPPMLNCTIWLKRYTKMGIKFPCYYSKVDPSLVISDLDYWKNTLNLIYSMAIPIPSFIISVIYLTYAYFKIYNEDEETVPLDKNAEDMDIDEEAVMDDSDGAALADNVAGSQIVNIDHMTAASIGSTDIILANGGPGMQKSISQGGGSLSASRSQHMVQSPGIGPLTPNSEMNSFGHQLNVQMADDMSRDSLENGVLSTSNSVQGNLSKTMTTSISTAPGPLANV